MAATYLPKQTLQFSATEYLKGTGPATFTVDVMDTSPVLVNGDFYQGYLTKADAMTASKEILAQRNTTWDDRSAVLFLRGPLTPTSQSSASSNETYEFTLSNYGAYSNFAYAVDTLSRTWLPAKEAVSGEASVSSTTEYITDGSKNPPPVMSLPSLKTRIGEIDAMLAAGTGKEGYADCIRASLVRERYFRNWTGPSIYEYSVNSGLAKGTQIDLSPKAWYDEYLIRTVSGTDADLFDVVVVDDDNDASNGHFIAEVILRPLPEGEFTYKSHMQPPEYTICDFNPTHNNYHIANVTVTDPAGTLHEAFFDPTAAGTGDVSPASFTLNGTATEITGLTWSEGKVRLSLNPYVSLVGYVLDFIELDGSVSLTLGVSEAELDVEGGTLSWDVSERPWEEGDMLMLRIRED